MRCIPPPHAYWICCTARSGSSLLCQILTATGVAGRPDEYFFWENMPAQAKPWGLAARWRITDLREYLTQSLRHGTTPNGWFGVKMAPALYLDTFVGELRKLPEYSDPALPTRELLGRFLPDLRFVYLTRRDKLRQAISWVKASQSNLWRSDQDVEPQGAARYEFESIDAQITQISLAESLWQQLFSDWGVRPLTLVYEDFLHDHEGMAARVLEFLGIRDAYTYAAETVTLERLGDRATETWAARYLREKQWV